MKVLTLSRNYPNPVLPHLGLWVEGLVRHTSELCEQRVVSPMPYAPPLPGLPEQYARFRRIPPTRRQQDIEIRHPRFLTGPGYSFHSFEASTYYAGIRGTIDRLRQEFPFDVIHAHFGYPDGVAAARLGQRYNVPVLITEHALWHPWMDDYPRARKQAVWAAAQCTFHLTGSCALRDSVVDFTGLPEKMRIIPIGMDDTVFTAEDSGAVPDANQILYVGRFQPVKGVDVLIQAMRLLIQQHSEAHLVLVGGSLYQTHEEQAVRTLVQELGLSQAVHFAGIKQPSEVAEFMRRSAVVVLPSRRESFGTVLVEALACGTPVVATRCGGPEDIVTPNNGYLVPMDDPRELAAALEQVLSQRSRFDSRQLSTQAIEQYSWRQVARKVVDLYKEAINLHRRD